jgi:hypothetical protein
MASFTNPFDDMDLGTTSSSSNGGNNNHGSNYNQPNQQQDDFDLMAAFNNIDVSTTNSSPSPSTSTKTSPTLRKKPSAIDTSALLSAPGTLATRSPKSSRSERRRRLSSRSKLQQSAGDEDAFEQEEEPNDPSRAAEAIRRGSIMKQQPGLRGLRMSFTAEQANGNNKQSPPPPPPPPPSDPNKRPKNVLCPSCGMGNQVPDGKTFFNCSSCSLEMVAKLSDVPKQSRLQCPNCSRSIVAPPNCEMFKCICGQTMVVPGSEMAKKIQQQGTKKGETIFVQDKSELYGAVHLRVTSKKIFRKWSPRFFSIQRGRLLLFRNKLKAAQGCPALVAIGLHPKQKVSHVKDTTNKDIEHLHMMTIQENVSERGSPRSGSPHGSFAFSDAQANRIACELACDSLDAANQLREKLDEMIHNMQEEMRRHH